METGKGQDNGVIKTLDSIDGLRMVMDACPVGVVVFNHDETMVYANPAAEEIFGRLAEPGKVKCGDFISCAHRHLHPLGCGNTPACSGCSLLAGMRAVLSSGATDQEGESFHDRDSECKPIWIKYKFSPVRLNGSPGAVMAVDDVTALRESEAKYRALIMQSADCLLLHDLDSKIVDVNPAACRTYGYSREELLRMRVSDLDPDYDQRENGGHFWEKFGLNEPYRFEGRQRRKDGTIFPVEVTVTKILISGRVHIMGLCRDIGERKESEAEKAQLEEQLRQAQKMQAIGTLAGGIAHDFNNILMPVIIQTEVALLSVPEDSPIRSSLQEVLEASHRAKGLVKQILTFSRQTETERVPLLVGPIVKEALKLLRSTLPTTIEIQQDIPVDDNYVLADPTQIHQVLMNLCTNAAHAMSESGGLLKVGLTEKYVGSTGHSDYPELVPGKYVQLSVRDTGCGIDPSVRDRIFEPFFTTKQRTEGTGMGLSVVHGIVKGYGGAVVVESQPGEGAVFHVLLPVVEGESRTDSQARGSLPQGKERILVVDDERSVIESWTSLLAYLGYEVTAEESSITAFETFRSRPEEFDLVITDQTMPNMRGDELARKLIEIDPAIPIVLCTGYSDVISEKKAKSLGIKEFIMKPIVMEEVAKTLRKVLDAK